MPRALISTRTSVPADRRDAYLAIAAEQRQRVVSAGGNYWLFENAGDSGDFMTFFEASDRSALDRVVGAQAGLGLESAPVFVELKLN